MKKFLPIAALGCLALALPARDEPLAYAEGKEAGPLSPADEPALKRISEDWKDAYNSGDAGRVAALYAEDGSYNSAHVAARGREAIRAYFQRGIDAGGHIDAVRVLESRSDGRLAYALGTYEATNAGRKVDGRVLLVLEKRSGQWLIAAHQVVVRDQP